MADYDGRPAAARTEKLEAEFSLVIENPVSSFPSSAGSASLSSPGDSVAAASGYSSDLDVPEFVGTILILSCTSEVPGMRKDLAAAAPEAP